MPVIIVGAIITSQSSFVIPVRQRWDYARFV